MTSAVPAAMAQTQSRADQEIGRRFYPDDPLWRDDDMRDIAPVAKRELSDSYDFLEHTFGERAGTWGPALNVNTLGEVPDSSWFTNRIGVREMSIEEVLRGPDTLDGPAPGPWEVLGRPGSGITPKFTIRDSRGVVFLIKLDPPAAPQLASSVEYISTKIFHAIGYHVPEDYLASLDPRQLRIAPGAKIKSDSGSKQPLRLADVLRWLDGMPRQANGTIRVLASRWVPGKVVGPFKYSGTRPDDPNDIYPHERRRELRALRVFAAWLNHDDARSLNTLDTYVEESGRRFIRHYLQDFGSTLGSGSTAAQQPRAGHEYLIEGDKIGKGLLGFGLWQRDWMRADYGRFASLGNLEATVFDPIRWRPEYPHPAFEQMDEADAFWAARIVSRFTNQMIRSIVETARLSNPIAARRLADLIIARRDKVVAAWITTTNPVDSIAVSGHGDGLELRFENAAHRLGLAPAAATYDVEWSSFDNRAGRDYAVQVPVQTTETRAPVPAGAWGAPDAIGDRYATASIRTIQANHRHWSRPVRITLRERGGVVAVVAVDRPTGE